MKLPLLWVLLLPLLICSSVKRQREDNSGVVDELEEEHAKKRLKFEQGVFNPAKVSGKINDPVLVRQISDFLRPGIQARLSWTSQKSNEYFETNSFFQDDLILRMGKIERLKRILLHSDLNVFENFQFPDTLLGKAKALALIYQTARTLLSSSSVTKQLLTLVYEESFDLARQDQDSFAKFLQISELNEPREVFRFFEYFLTNGKVADLIEF